MAPDQQPHLAPEELRTPLATAHGLLGDRPRDAPAAVAAHFGAKFGASPAALQQVPVLTLDSADTLPANSLVRLRGMVADMFNPEFFLGAYTTPGAPGAWKPAALWTDAPPADLGDAGASVIMERRPLLLTPVPSEAPWASAAWAGRPLEPETPRTTDRLVPKRSRQLGGELPPPAMAGSDSAAGPASKAPRTGGDGSDAGARDQDGAAAAAARAAGLQPVAAAAAADQDDEHAVQRPGFARGDCIVQVYTESDAFKLHDVVEVLGVLSVVPDLAALQLVGPPQQERQQQQQGDAMDADGQEPAPGQQQQQQPEDEAMAVDDDLWQERTAALPPTSQVLRVHALAIRKVPPHPGAAALPASPSDKAALVAALPALRQRALSLLAAPLAGDELAAEYLLLVALGSVASREDGAAIGLLPLNLTHCPSAESSVSEQLVHGLAAALHCLLPHVALLPLDVPALNRRRWFPSQHAASGRLFRGCLQQAGGALLLLDETRLNAGQLGENGLKNLEALRQVLTAQQLPCHCQVYTHSLHVNQPAVLLSSAGRSMLRDGVPLLQLPLQPQRPVLRKPAGDAGAAAAAGSAADAAAGPVGDWAAAEVAGPEAMAAAAAAMPELGAVRDYLAAARSLQCSLDQGAAEACVARFRAQQRAEPGLGMDDLNRLITLAKLLSVSLGHEAFSLDSWERVVQLEALRKARVAATAQRRGR